jgi:hypothetical protein
MPIVSDKEKISFCSKNGGKWSMGACELNNAKYDVAYESADANKAGKLVFRDRFGNKAPAQVVTIASEASVGDGVRDKIAAGQSINAPIRVGGASASIGKVDAKQYLPGDKTPDIVGSHNTAAWKPGSQAVGEFKLGRACTAEEIAVAPWSWASTENKIAWIPKLFKSKKATDAAKEVEKGVKKVEEKTGTSVKAKGPNLSVDPVCVDPVQLVKQSPVESVELSVKKAVSDLANIVSDRDGFFKKANNTDTAFKERMKALEE